MKQWYLMLMLVTFAVTGCSSKGGEKNADAAGDKGTFTAPPVLQGDRVGNGVDDASANGKFGMPATKVIHFDYDKYDIRAGDREVLQQHAQYMKGNGAKMRLEGHADERGSLEYNYALGEKRANSAKNTLKLFGVGDDQVSVLSYGETMPVNPGHNESAWQQNRRVELAYPQN
jgi:peptidoglycan-associated lipoprotein